ncbi:MAG: TetR/AcrR family transcriptional regulator [Anaerolineae bacterium]
MARPKNTAQYEASRAQILDTARRQMALHGTAGLGLRAIARELQWTPTALYHYFPSMDDLITELIVDAFNGLADALEAARDAAPGGPLNQLRDVMLAYRAWAVAHPTDFSLIYGNPIPGYEAPRDVTVPAVIRGYTVFLALIEELLQRGQLVPKPPYVAIPPEIEMYLQRVILRDETPVSAHAMYLTVVAWTVGHGAIMLELFHHLQPVIGDPSVFYAAQVDALFVSFGAPPG